MMTSEVEQSISNEACFEEGEVYRAMVVGISIEDSKRYPGTKYPRIKFQVQDNKGRQKAMSWIPWEQDEIFPAIAAIDPAARQKKPSALIGQECCVRISLRRGVVVREILPKTALSSPTLAEQEAELRKIVPIAP